MPVSSGTIGGFLSAEGRSKVEDDLGISVVMTGSLEVFSAIGRDDLREGQYSSQAAQRVYMAYILVLAPSNGGASGIVDGTLAGPSGS